MRLRSILLSLCFFLILLGTFSCKDNKDSALNCGCNGPVFKTVENEEASYLGNGYFVIGTGSGNEPVIYGWACEEDTTLQKSSNQYVRDYIISGNLKKSCPVNDIVFPSDEASTIDMLDVTAIRRK